MLVRLIFALILISPSAFAGTSDLEYPWAEDLIHSREKFARVIEVIRLGGGEELLEKARKKAKVATAEDLYRVVVLRLNVDNEMGHLQPRAIRYSQALNRTGRYKWDELVNDQVRESLAYKKYDTKYSNVVEIEQKPVLSVTIHQTLRQTALTVAHELTHFVLKPLFEFGDITRFADMDAYIDDKINFEAPAIETEMRVLATLNKRFPSSETLTYREFFDQNGIVKNRAVFEATLRKNQGYREYYRRCFYVSLQAELDSERDDIEHANESMQAIYKLVDAYEKNGRIFQFNLNLSKGTAEASQWQSKIAENEAALAFYSEMFKQLKISIDETVARNRQVNRQFARYLTNKR